MVAFPLLESLCVFFAGLAFILYFICPSIPNEFLGVFELS